MSSSRQKSRFAKRPGKSLYRLAIVAPLEPRLLMASISWNGGTGDWSNPASWSGGVVPQSTDTVSITGVGSTVNITTDAQVGSISAAPGVIINLNAGGTLDIFSSSSLACALTGTSGTLNLRSSLDFSGYGQFTGTTISGSGTFNNSGVATFSGDSLGASIINTSSISFGGGTTLSKGTTIDNAAMATVSLTDLTGLTANGNGTGATPVLMNAGTVDLSGGNGTATLSGVDLQNIGGTIEVDAGTLADASDAEFQNTTFDLGNNASFAFNGSTYLFSGATKGTGTGSLLFNTGTVVAENPDGSAPTSATLNFSIGFADVTGTAFAAGTTGTEVTNLNYLNYTGSAQHANLGLINQGTIDVTGSGNLGLGTGGGFTNDSVGTVNFESDAGVTGLSGGGSFTNMGLVEKVLGSGDSVIGTGTIPINLTNDGGSFGVLSGTLGVHDGGSGTFVFTAGPISVSSGATFNIDLGNGTLDSAGTFTASGGGQVTFTSGTWLGPSAASGQNGSTGTLDFSPGTFTVDGGSFSGPTSVINTGEIDCQNSTAFGGFTNDGTVLVAGGETLALSADLINQISGTIKFTGDGTTVTGSTLINNGTILKSAGTGTVDLHGLSLSPTGTVQVDSGTIALPSDSGTVPAGTSLIAEAGGTFTFAGSQGLTTNNGTITLGGAGASIPALSSLATNTGTIRVLSGASVTTGALSNTGTIDVGGDLTINGNFTESGSPTLAYSFAASPGAGAPLLTVNGGVALAGSLSAALVNSFSPGPGVSYTAATFANAATGSFTSTTGVGPNFTVTVNPTSLVLETSSTAPPNPLFGLSPVVTRSTLPTAVVSGVPVKGSISVTATNTATTIDKGANLIKLYASTDGKVDSGSTLITSFSRKLNVKPGKAIKLAVPVKALNLPTGSYMLLVQITDVANVALASATGPAVVSAAPFVTLSETVVSALPASLVSGTTVRGSVRLVITNHGNVPSRGSTPVSISASTTSGQVGTQIAALTKSLNIRPGKSVTVVVPVKSIPALATADYFIIGQVTDPFASGISVNSSTGTTSIGAPVISLSAVLGPAINPNAGDTLSITNSGNIPDVTALTGTVAFSTDAAGTQAVGGTAFVSTATLKIGAGKTVRLHLNQWKSLLTGLTAGTQYYLTVSLADLTSHSISAVSPTAFTAQNR
jgi:hypothetical protein